MTDKLKHDTAQTERQNQREIIAKKTDSLRAVYTLIRPDSETVNHEIAPNIDRYVYDRNRVLSQQYHNRLNAQAGTLVSLLSVSPAATYAYLCSDIAGTGISSYNWHITERRRKRASPMQQ